MTCKEESSERKRLETGVAVSEDGACCYAATMLTSASNDASHRPSPVSISTNADSSIPYCCYRCCTSGRCNLQRPYIARAHIIFRYNHLDQRSLLYTNRSATTQRQA